MSSTDRIQTSKTYLGAFSGEREARSLGNAPSSRGTIHSEREHHPSGIESLRTSDCPVQSRAAHLQKTPMPDEPTRRNPLPFGSRWHPHTDSWTLPVRQQTTPRSALHRYPDPPHTASFPNNPRTSGRLPYGYDASPDLYSLRANGDRDRNSDCTDTRSGSPQYTPSKAAPESASCVWSVPAQPQPSSALTAEPKHFGPNWDKKSPPAPHPSSPRVTARSNSPPSHAQQSGKPNCGQPPHGGQSREWTA